MFTTTLPKTLYAVKDDGALLTDASAVTDELECPFK